MHAFRVAVESREFDTIGDLFAEEAVLHSPITHRPYQGRCAIATIISGVAKVLENFRFQKEMSGGHAGDHALLFDATVDGLRIQGCDFVHTREDGLIDEITVMLRPFSAVAIFADKMRVELGR